MKKDQIKQQKIILGVLIGIIVLFVGMAMFKDNDDSTQEIKGRDIEVKDMTMQKEELPTIPGTDTATFEEIEIGTSILILGEEEISGVLVARAIIIGESEESLSGVASGTGMMNRERQQEDTTTTKDVSDTTFQNEDMQARREQMMNLSEEERLAMREQMGVDKTVGAQDGTVTRSRLMMQRYVGTVTEMNEKGFSIKNANGDMMIVIHTQQTGVMKMK